MEHQRSKKTKSLRAARAQSRSENMDTHLVTRGLSPIPPARNLVKKFQAVRRFVQNGVVSNQAFTLANGHDQFLCVTNVSGAAVPIADCWRIKRIDVWAISEGNFPTSVIVTPTGSDITSNNYNDPEAAFEITSRSASEPAKMSIVPSKKSPMGSWHFTSNTNFAGALFQMSINTPGGSNNYRVTLDITFEYVLNWVGLPLGYGIVTATTTLGTIGCRGILSGFIPQGINSLG